MKNQNPLLRFFLRSLVAAVLMGAVITPITAVAVPDNLYVSANQGRSIFEYTPAGTQSTFAVVNPQLPRGLAFDSNGNLFAATNAISGTQGTVLKFNPAGAQHTFGGGPGFFSGLAVDSTGNVFVMSENSQHGTPSTIFKFTASGTRSVFGSLPGQGFGLAFNS